MDSKLIAVYKREDTYSGHSRINHYHIPVEIECWVLDNSDLRDAGTMVNGEPIGDFYHITTANYKGVVTARYMHTERSKANECLKALLSHGSGWKRIK